MQFPEAKIIEINGVRLAVHEAGQGIPVLLAHGWPELAYSWRHQVPALVAAGYRVIAPDQRGYGESDQPENVEEYDIHHLAGDHMGLLDALEIEKAVFVGHDWGAIVVWQDALMYPDRVVGVANLSVPFSPRAPTDPVAFWEKNLGQDFYIVHFNRQPGVAAKAFEANPELFLRNLYRTGQWREAADFGTAGRGILDLAREAREAGDLMMSEDELSVFVEAFRKSGFFYPCNWYRNFTRNWETTADLDQQVTQPSLMIYGEHDMVPANPNMADHVSDLEVHTLDCGHWIQQECPEETNRILVEWLDRRMQGLFA